MPGRIRPRQSAFTRDRDIPKYDEPFQKIRGRSACDVDAVAEAAEAWAERPEVRLSDDDIEKWLETTYGPVTEAPACGSIPMAMEILPVNHADCDDEIEREVVFFTTDIVKQHQTSTTNEWGQHTSSVSITGVIMGEIAPRSWVPSGIPSAVGAPPLNAETFWEYLKTTPPEPQEGFKDTQQPFWRLYPARHADFLPEITHLEDLTDDLIVEPTESRRERERRLDDHGSLVTAQRWLEKRERNRERGQERNSNRHRKEPEYDQNPRGTWPSIPHTTAPVADAKPVTSSVTQEAVERPLTPITLHPKIKVLVRAVTEADVPQLCNLYNSYVTDPASCAVPDENTRNHQSMQQLIRSIQINDLPFLVAVALNSLGQSSTTPSIPTGPAATTAHPRPQENGGNQRGQRGGYCGRGRGRGRGQGGRFDPLPRRPIVPTTSLPGQANSRQPIAWADEQPAAQTGKILGFVYADMHAPSKSVYRFTADLSLFVLPSMTRKGVASCLLDAFLGIADPSYRRLGGYSATELFPVQGSQVVRRRIKTILVEVPFYKGERPRWLFEWKTKKDKEGEDGWGFKMVGTIEAGGTKGFRRVDRCILQRNTSETIYDDNAKAPGVW